MSPDSRQRFGGIARLYGEAALTRFAAARVCLIGTGGVGSWTAESLARSGIGAVTLVDMDDVCITNVNRQLPALDGTVGRPKVRVLAERMALIHPACRVEPVEEFLTAQNAAQILAGPWDCVIDAVDRAVIKALIIATCVRTGIPVVTSGGAGGRRDATAVRCGDLASTGGDQLLRGVRRELRRSHGFPGGENAGPLGVSAVYSAEPPVYP
jgi:tRNA threonylcarbamoyladenosine dehydratase